jgi:hypothetical protein
MLIAGVAVKAAARIVNFENAEMDGFRNQAKTLVAVVDRLLGVAIALDFVFQGLVFFNQFENRRGTGHRHHFHLWQLATGYGFHRPGVCPARLNGRARFVSNGTKFVKNQFHPIGSISAGTGVTLILKGV